MGLHRAGFDVYGIDIHPQPRYPFKFYQTDAVKFIERWGSEFDAIVAGWPCQAYTACQQIQGNAHPMLIEPGREVMRSSGRPYVIENVEGAREHLINPTELCGCMFPDLNVYRTRLFEASFDLPQPAHRPHVQLVTKMGRPPVDGERMHVVGNFSGVNAARSAMGIDWMTRDGLREAVPPAYGYWIGKQLLAQVDIRDTIVTEFWERNKG